MFAGRHHPSLSLHDFAFSQRYAARDAYVSYVLYGRISELSDPIFRDAEDLHPGDTVRLYTRGGNDCVGEGCIVEYSRETWGSTGIFLAPRRATRGLTRRWVVRLSKVLVPLASTLYPDETETRRAQQTAHLGGRVNETLLWDADRMRKAPANSGHSEMSSTQAVAAASGVESGPNAEQGSTFTTEATQGSTATGVSDLVVLSLGSLMGSKL